MGQQGLLDPWFRLQAIVSLTLLLLEIINADVPFVTDGGGVRLDFILLFLVLASFLIVVCRHILYLLDLAKDR